MDELLRDERRRVGVVTRSDVLDAGRSPRWLAARVRSGHWQRVHPGVYVRHGGPLPWRVRAAAAVAYAGPGAALGLRSAGFVCGVVRRPPRTIEVVVPWERRVVTQPGLVVLRRRYLDGDVVRDPLPRTRTDRTVAELTGVARTADELIGVLTDGLRAGADLLCVEQSLAAMSRHPWRAVLAELLAEVDEGVESALEHRYHRVEQRHGLPAARLQVRTKVGGRWIRSDRRYEEHALRVELDGRLAHPEGATDGDTWRDNDVAIDCGELTLRYRWRHVVAAPCATAGQVARALRARGWTGALLRCGPTCRVVS